MYSNEDFENFYVRYKAEALPRNISVREFCIRNKVPWNLFDRWYRDTRHRIKPVSVIGMPEASGETTSPPDSSRQPDSDGAFMKQLTQIKDGIRISVDIRISNGMQIRQKNLSYEKLVELVEKVEDLC